MFYIERSIEGPVLCSDLHDCMCIMPSGELTWLRNGIYAHGFQTKEAAEEFCRSHGFNLERPANTYDPRYIIVEELRLSEVSDIVKKYNAIITDDSTVVGPIITWGNTVYGVKIVTNRDVYERSQQYVYVVGARLLRLDCPTVIEEIHNPGYEQLNHFIDKCIKNYRV